VLGLFIFFLNCLPFCLSSTVDLLSDVKSVSFQGRRYLSGSAGRNDGISGNCTSALTSFNVAVSNCLAGMPTAEPCSCYFITLVSVPTLRNNTFLIYFLPHVFRIQSAIPTDLLATCPTLPQLAGAQLNFTGCRKCESAPNIINSTVMMCLKGVQNSSLSTANLNWNCLCAQEMQVVKLMQLVFPPSTLLSPLLH
jgi:hypothetical protein